MSKDLLYHNYVIFLFLLLLVGVSHVKHNGSVFSTVDYQASSGCFPKDKHQFEHQLKGKRMQLKRLLT